MTESHAQSQTGGCSCGALRYRISGAPLIIHGCHCSQCQRQTGSAFATNMLMMSEDVSFDGAMEEVLMPSPSGTGQRIFRCPSCKIAVSSHYGGAGDLIHFIRLGTLDDPGDLQPDAHIYTSTKRPWVTLPVDRPAFEEFYNPAEVWSAEALARFREAKGE